MENKLAPEKELTPKEYIKSLERQIDDLRAKLFAKGSEELVRPVETVMTSVGTKEEMATNTELKYEEREPRKVDLLSYSEVMWAQGVTLNIGNYESARIDVSVKEYCPTEKKEELLAKLKEFTVGAIKKERLQIEAYRNRRPGQQ